MRMYPNLTNFIIFTVYSSKYGLFHNINHVHGIKGIRGSSVIRMTRIQALGYEERKRGSSLVLSLRIGTEAQTDFF
jgi:hypothetical protein